MWRRPNSAIPVRHTEQSTRPQLEREMHAFRRARSFMLRCDWLGGLANQRRRLKGYEIECIGQQTAASLSSENNVKCYQVGT